MERIDEIIKQLRGYAPDKQETKLLEIVRAHEPEIVDQNILQMMEGKDADGNPIAPPYRSAAYAELKRQLNPRGVVDLHLSGNFHRSIFLKTNSFPVTSGATDEKTTDLVNKYGHILDTPDERKEVVAKDILGPDVMEFYTGEVLKI